MDAVAGLSARLIGIVAVCLAAVAAPVPGPARVVALAAFGLGLAMAAVMPGYDRWAAWIVGPSVLVLALAPLSGVWIGGSVVALIMLGFACLSFVGMERAVPALGLPLFTYAFRSGEMVSAGLVGAWAVAVVALVVLANRVSPVGRGAGLHGPVGAGLAPPGEPMLVFGRRRAFQAVAVAALVSPVALVGAVAAGRFSPMPPAGPGSSGAVLQAHPGLTGGLDTGLPVALSDDVVLRVEAPNPRFWRGTTYDQWDGRRWTTSATSRAVAWTSDALLLAPAEGDVSAGSGLLEPVTEVQRFTVTQAGLDVLVGAWQVTGVQTTGRSATVGDDGTIRLSTPLPAGATWTVTSELVPAGPDELRRADPAEIDPTSPLLARYAREDDISPATNALALEVTAGAATTYDKVLALEAWIDDNITYTRDIPPLAEEVDAVDHFLFDSRQGFCEQIGSALVVMLRSLGIPARLAVGYVPGSYDAERGEWVSRGTDAHAWAEVWFPGVGWHAFDPTAGVPMGGDPAPGAGPGGLRLVSAVPSDPAAVAGTGTVVAAFGAAVVALWRRRAGVAGRREAGTDDGRLAGLQERFDHCGRALGRDWPPSMTLREKARDLVATGVDQEVVIAAAGALERLWFHDLDRSAWLDHGAGAVGNVLSALERATGAVAAYTPKVSTSKPAQAVGGRPRSAVVVLHADRALHAAPPAHRHAGPGQMVDHPGMTSPGEKATITEPHPSTKGQNTIDGQAAEAHRP